MLSSRPGDTSIGSQAGLLGGSGPQGLRVLYSNHSNSGENRNEGREMGIIHSIYVDNTLASSIR